MLRALFVKINALHSDNVSGGGSVDQHGQYSIQSREEFAVTACQTLFGFLAIERHNDFANWFMQKANLYVSNSNHAELIYYNRFRQAIEQYETDVGDAMGGSLNEGGGSLVQTAAVKMYLEQLKGFLASPCQAATFLLVGPAGAAKTLLLQEAVSQFSGYDLITINCSTQLTPSHIIHSLRQVSQKIYKYEQTLCIWMNLCYTKSCLGVI